MKLLDILSCLLTSMLLHGYMPKQMLVYFIVPVVKNKNSSLSSKNNYRPVALSLVILKIFKKLLLSRIEAYINILNYNIYMVYKRFSDLKRNLYL